MGIFDFLNSGSPAPAAAPPVAAPQNPTPNYNDFYQRLIAAAVANGRAHPSSLFNMLSGRGTDAAKAEAEAAAPGAWQQFQQGSTATQTGQLGAARDFASTGALTGVNVDPNNPMAAVPDLTKAYAGVMAPGQPGQPGQAAGGADNPIQAQRAMYLRMGRFMQMQGQAQMAKEFFSLASQGIPDQTAVAPNGAVSDPINGQAINVDAGTLAAGRAGQTSEAQAIPQRKTAAIQAGLDRTTHSVNADTDASHELVNGIDPKTGQPVTRTRADILANGSFVSNNPYFDGQQAELKDLRAKSESADQGLNLGSQIVNAANGVLTGKGANALQDVRKMAQTAAQLTGVKLDPAIDNDTSQFEQLKFASQQLVAVASHELSPRVAMNIYNQIAAVKPGDQTSVQGLRDIIVKQLVPVFQRNKAIFGATSDYYKKNPITNDAGSKVPDSLPLGNFGVRDIEHARPGDYFLDPISGNLRQRPLK